MMKLRFFYFYLQLKKIYQQIPRFLTGTLVLILLIGIVSFYGTKLLYPQQSTKPTVIAVVVEDTSPLMELGLTYLNSSESVHSFCQLLMVEQKEALEMLENHQAVAMIYFPKNFSKDIVSGKNTPATITFSETCGIEQYLFRELATAASQILGYAQANVYAADDIYNNYQMNIRKQKLMDQLNQHTMQRALIRSDLFQVQTISSTGNLSAKEFYTITGLILLIFLGGLPLGGFAKPDTYGIAGLLSRQKLGPLTRTFCKFAAMFVFYLFLWGMLLLGGAAIDLFPWNYLLLLPAAAGLTSSWTLFWYHLTRHETAGTLFLFFAVLFCILCSGCLIPASFLPQPIVNLGTLLPTYHTHLLFRNILTGSSNAYELLSLCLFIIVFFILSGFCASYAERMKH